MSAEAQRPAIQPANIRHAFVFASLGRYASKAINLAMTVVIARLMGPKEFGVSVLGMSAFLILDAIRELASANYLVQQKELSRGKINSAFTISLGITVVLTLVVVLLAYPIAALYGEPRLASYIHVVAVAFAVGPLMQPIYALWSRGLAFRTIACMDVLGAIVNAAASVLLVWLGFGYMGLAWGTAVSAGIGTCVACWLSRHELAMLRLSLKEWRGVLAFGIYGSATAIIYRVGEAFSFLVFGKILNTQAVGLLQRAFVLSSFPDSVILAGVGSIALPAFSQHARSGADLKQSYLAAVAQVTAVQWPALAFICAMATPLTRAVLGPLWMEAAPLVQILAIALMFNFAAMLNFPVLVAVGAIRSTLPTALIQVSLSLAVTVWAASMGLRALALSTLVTVPLGLVLWTRLVRTHVPFGLGEFLAALRKSFLVLLFSAAGPLAVLTLRKGTPSIPDAVVAGILWAAGWLLAIRLTRHPLLNELAKARGFIQRRWSRKSEA